jgi:polar amino acid transport system substrate-binding protein
LREVRLGLAVGVMTCAYRKEREQFIIFSDPISSFTNGFFTREDYKGPELLDLDDAKDLKTGSVKGYESLKALKDKGFKPVEANTSKLALSMLLGGRFDLLYIGKEKTEFDLKQQGLHDKVIFHPVIKKRFHFCFSKNYPDIEKIASGFNQTLKRMREDRTYANIHKKYR